MIVVKAPQNYLNEAGLIKRIGEFVAPITRRNVMIITSPRAWQATEAAIRASFAAQDIAFSLHFTQGYCTAAGIAALTAQAAAQSAELILGVGGGRVLDTAKGIAESSGQLPFITVPTIAATCAAWSPIAVLYSEAGGHLNSMPLQRTPTWVLVDGEILVDTPVRYLRAGIVDALAKWYEFEPYLRQNDTSLALALKAQAARLALDIFLAHATQAIADNQAGRVTPVFNKVVDAVIALAGMANSMRDEFPRIGIAHAVHNSITHQPDLHGFLHGELVGYGLVVQSHLDDIGAVERGRLLALLAELAMPMTLEAIGGTDEAAARIACGVAISPAIAAQLPFTITTERIEQALRLTTAPKEAKGLATGASV